MKASLSAREAFPRFSGSVEMSQFMMRISLTRTSTNTTTPIGVCNWTTCEEAAIRRCIENRLVKTRNINPGQVCSIKPRLPGQ